MESRIEYAIIGLNDANQFGEAVRLFRKQRGITQKQLADKAGCSIMFVSNLERGKETAELGRALRVLDALDVRVSLSDERGTEERSRE